MRGPELGCLINGTFSRKPSTRLCHCSQSTFGNLSNANLVLDIFRQVSIFNNHLCSYENFYTNCKKIQSFWDQFKTADLTKTVFPIKLHDVSVVKSSSLTPEWAIVDCTWHIHFTQSLMQPALGSLIRKYIFPEKWAYVNLRTQKYNSALKTVWAVWEIHMSSLRNEVNRHSSEKRRFLY